MAQISIFEGAALLSLFNNLSRSKNAELRHVIDDDGMTLLHHAAAIDNSEITQGLVDSGCDVNARNRQGMTPLSLAVQAKNASVVKVLLAAKADIFLHGRSRKSPAQAVLDADSHHDLVITMLFLEAIRSDDSVATAKALLEARCTLPRALLLKNITVTRYGASVDDVDRDGNTALHCAVQAMDLRLVKLLVEWAADVKVVNSSLQTPLHLYGVGRDEGREILRTLLDNGAPLYERDAHGIMSIARIFDRGDADTIKMILDYDVDLHATNADGTTLLHFAAFNPNPGVMQHFQGKDFDVNAANIDGETAVWYTLDHVNHESLKFLLENGADLRSLDKNGYTAFFQGFYEFVDKNDNIENSLRCIELFLQYGAQVDCVDEFGGTIFDYALSQNCLVLTKPILEYVAMGEAIDKPVATNEIFLTKIDSYEKFRSHFEVCKKKIEKMKRVVIFEKVTLFKFLKDDENKLEKYVRNDKMMENLKKVMYGMRRSNWYFVKTLRRRVEEAIKAAKLREEAAVGLLKIEGLNKNPHVVEKILTYFCDEDLGNVSLI